jgi:Ca-activated chloride channel homolog
VLVFSLVGFQTKEVKIENKNRIDVSLELDVKQFNEVAETENYEMQGHENSSSEPKAGKGAADSRINKIMAYRPLSIRAHEPEAQFNTEEYEGISENVFHDARHNPLFTFSIDVDAASYSNIRRFIQGGQRPPQDAVRIEETVNYFHYDYPQPRGEESIFNQYRNLVCTVERTT